MGHGSKVRIVQGCRDPEGPLLPATLGLLPRLGGAGLSTTGARGAQPLEHLGTSGLRSATESAHFGGPRFARTIINKFGECRL